MIRAESRVSGSTGVSTVVSTAVSTVAIRFVSARKRRTLTIRKGMKRIRMKVAIAEPSPKRF